MFFFLRAFWENVMGVAAEWTGMQTVSSPEAFCSLPFEPHKMHARQADSPSKMFEKNRFFPSFRSFIRGGGRRAMQGKFLAFFPQGCKYR